MSRKVDISVPAHVGRKFARQLAHLVPALIKEHGVRGEYLHQEIFSKYVGKDLQTVEPASPTERKDAAIAKFRRAEQRNAKTNLRLYWDEPRNFPDFEDIMEDARRIVQQILGPVRYPAILWKASLTNGASTRVRRSPYASGEKLTGEVNITDRALAHWKEMTRHTRLETLPTVLVKGSKLFTVPKNSLIDRCACKEPEGNMLLQRSVGLAIRERLRRVGLDLRDQSRNRRLAHLGSQGYGLSTIDLSSASDTMSMGIVRALCPFEWWDLMTDLRVEYTEIEGEYVPLEMFSSMGNGFTFELETLLFFSLAIACFNSINPWWRGRKIADYKHKIRCYGDDIIVPDDVSRRLMRVLSWCGFIPNPDKTFITGFFRESCGGHYNQGIDVTPFYLRRDVRTLPDMINILNHLLEWDGRGWGFFSSKEAYCFWSAWKDYIPKALWGGIDPRDPSCLVTGDTPRQRIIGYQTKRAPESVSAGLYLDWHLRKARSTLKQEEWTFGDGNVSVTTWEDPQLELDDELWWVNPILDHRLTCNPRSGMRYAYEPVTSLGARTAWYPELMNWDPAEKLGHADRWGP